MYLYRKNLEGYVVNNGFLEDWDYVGFLFFTLKVFLKFNVFMWYVCYFYN